MAIHDNRVFDEDVKAPEWEKYPGKKRNCSIGVFRSLHQPPDQSALPHLYDVLQRVLDVNATLFVSDQNGAYWNLLTDVKILLQDRKDTIHG